jgi:glycosyltransferase involved in cell wall biosynthesis
MRVAIAWHGLPFYAARLMRPVVSKLGANLTILATEGPQSPEKIEEALGAPIKLISDHGRLSWKQLRIEPPELFLHTGWAYQSFHALAHGVKEQGGTVVCMVDNTRKNNLRQAIGKHVFRWVYRPSIDAALVPGESGKQLMKYFGMPDASVHTGMYGADPKAFLPGPPLSERQYDFLFAGQFIQRKGVLGLIRAVKRLRAEARDFTIAAVGDGPLRKNLESGSIEIHPFGGAETVARLMRKARFLILPSIEDHWGVVVHEAALSGCGLVLSRGVGARLDLLTPRNGFACEPGQPERAMRQALHVDGPWLEECRQESFRLARGFGPERWQEVFWRIYTNASDAQQLKPKEMN